MDGLNEAYRRIRGLIGPDVEDLESVQLVETYRRFFRPTRIKVILLAESHVFTNAQDRQITLPAIAALPGYPTQYARFVYCLAYGERKLTSERLHPRDGTPQFWKIFFSCANPISSGKDFAPILGNTPQPERLQNKIELLLTLRTNGVWLVDTSIVALYKGGEKVPNLAAALEESWHSYTKEVVLSAHPVHVICIGKGVASVVSNDLKRALGDNFTVIPQPNAFLSATEHLTNYQRYSEICLRHAGTQ